MTSSFCSPVLQNHSSLGMTDRDLTPSNSLQPAQDKTRWVVYPDLVDLFSFDELRSLTKYPEMLGIDG